MGRPAISAARTRICWTFSTLPMIFGSQPMPRRCSDVPIGKWAVLTIVFSCAGIKN